MQSSVARVPAFLQSRYGTPVPRYTSYPTAVDWHAGRQTDDYVSLLARAASKGTPLSVYVHVPFCRQRCGFCACNVTVAGDRAVGDDYLRSLERELETVASSGITRRPVTQVHLGGGTPTWLTLDQLAQVVSMLEDTFDIMPDAERALEADPRSTSLAQIRLLGRAGYNRLSVGVQDFDADVQAAVLRRQSVDDTRELLDVARQVGFRSINVDLIYGLPEQTRESFARTIDSVRGLAPERIALFHLAYVPQLKRNQIALDMERAPSSDEKIAMFADASRALLAAGYEFIGIDHFARSDDELVTALRSGAMQRNFMGYTVRSGDDIVAFGPSAIGHVDGTYVQNLREPADWGASIARCGHGNERSYAMTDEDRLRGDVIMGLMCRMSVDKRAVESAHGIAFDDVFGSELDRLGQFADDGLVELSSREITVTPLGRVFLRHIAAVFDAYRTRTGEPGFSKAV